MFKAQLLGYSVNAINTELTTGRLDAGANFDPNHGDLHGHTFLIVALNGTAGYQAGQDLVIDITATQHLTSLTTGNFIS